MKDPISVLEYDPEDYATYMEQQTPWGEVNAFAIAKEEDFDVANSWDGARIANYKCNIQRMNKKIKAYKQRLRGMEILYSNLKQSIDPTDPVMKKIARQIKIMRRDVDIMKQQNKENCKQFPEYCDKILNDRREYRKKMDEHIAAQNEN